MAVIPYQPYSPDLAPYDFFLFPKMKLKLKGRRFDTFEIRAESQGVLDTEGKGLLGSVPNIERRWDRCLHVRGNYFEGDDGR
jgi:hypothetical protein